MAECLEIPGLFSNIYFLPEKFLMKLNIFFKRIYRHLIFMLMLVFLPGFLFSLSFTPWRWSFPVIFKEFSFNEMTTFTARCYSSCLDRRLFFFFFTRCLHSLSRFENFHPQNLITRTKKKSEKSCMAVSEFGQKSFTPADYLYVEKRK